MNSTIKIELGKTYKTRFGRSVYFFARLNNPLLEPEMRFVGVDDGGEMDTWNEAGFYAPSSGKTSWDIVDEALEPLKEMVSLAKES